MSRFFNRFACWVAGLSMAAAAQSAWAFSFYGPSEAFQLTTIGYEKHVFIQTPDGLGWTFFADDFTFHPRNLGEESRWNNPVLYYACDQSFLDYFGASGMAAVDAAAAVFNNLSNVDYYSTDLHEFPLEESRVNYTASALHLFDLKSTTMELFLERLGLADPERWAWCIRNQILPPTFQCPRYDYTVIQRNFDPVTTEPSRFVNGNLFTYEIEQSCPPAELFGDAIEFLVDPDGIIFSALATPKLSFPDAAFYGWFHTGLTRDDMGGLRYLYSANNMNIEAAGANAVTFVTDTNTVQLLFTSNLTTFASQALTNSPAALLALYPNLSIAGSTSIFTNIYVTNLTAYFTNYPFDPVGTPAHLVFLTNRTLTVQTYYHHTFNNVVTFAFTNGSWAAIPFPNVADHIGRQWITIQTTSVTNSPFAPVGSPLVTNTTSVTYPTNVIVGEYAILPPTGCGINILGVQATTTTLETNLVNSVINGIPGATNAQFFTQTVIDYFTNHVFLINPIVCLTNTVALRQGVGKVSFVHTEFDSLLGQFYTPITNNYTLTAVTNFQLFPQHIQRVVTQPDILFTAQDLQGTVPSFRIPTVVRSTPVFESALAASNAPTVIRGPVVFTYNKVGPLYVNGQYPFFVDESGALVNFIWANYDATTNAPTLYPSGTSIAALEAQVLTEISPPVLSDGVVGTAYSAQMSVTAATTSWQPPVSWSLAPSSPGLPSGLSLSPAGGLSGTPSQAGFYNFTIQAMDSLGRTAQRTYIVNVLPKP
jgi:hypothetical protein